MGAGDLADYPVAAKRSSDCSDNDFDRAELPKIRSEKMGLRVNRLSLPTTKDVRDTELQQEQKGRKCRSSDNSRASLQ